MFMRDSAFSDVLYGPAHRTSTTAKPSISSRLWAEDRRGWSIRKGLVPASGYLLCMIFDLCTVEVIGMVFGAKPVNTLCTHMVLNPFGCKRRQLLLFPIWAVQPGPDRSVDWSCWRLGGHAVGTVNPHRWCAVAFYWRLLFCFGERWHVTQAHHHHLCPILYIKLFTV